MKNWKLIAGIGAALLLILLLVMVLAWPKSESAKQAERDRELDALIHKGEERQRKTDEVIKEYLEGVEERRKALNP